MAKFNETSPQAITERCKANFNYEDPLVITARTDALSNRRLNESQHRKHVYTPTQLHLNSKNISFNKSDTGIRLFNCRYINKI